MKKLSAILAALLLSAFGAGGASAAQIDLAGWATYSDGAYTGHDLVPNQTIVSQSFSLTFTGAGSHTAIGFVDAEIDQDINTWFNEFGAATGSLASGQSWEIDEPGYVFGDIIANMKAGFLDNGNGVPANGPDDVSMALGWDFILGADQTAVVTFLLSSDVPTTDFYLSQTDPDSDATIYFSSRLVVRGCPPEGCNPIPEPGMAWLLAPALMGLVWSRRKSIKRD